MGKDRTSGQLWHFLVPDQGMADYTDARAAWINARNRIASSTRRDWGGAGHYFFINDDGSNSVALDTGRYRYKPIQDPVTDEAPALRSRIDLDGYGARWLLYEQPIQKRGTTRRTTVAASLVRSSRALEQPRRKEVVP